MLFFCKKKHFNIQFYHHDAYLPYKMVVTNLCIKQLNQILFFKL